ncbi:hypothetical protein ACJMK2_035156 [Sinanodonta woodiana]|uniref:HECT domain-containing protein n=1 Tax=Sinanodonta woodiana TaxID=1069815 RepID=A0ABD3WUI0_SINWO
MFTVLGWGSTQHAQLGIGYTDKGSVILPQVIETLQGKDIEDISNGDRHSLFLSKTGKVYSCGDNEWGQLGQDKSQSHPEQVLDLDSHFVMQVAAGACHSLSLTKAGEVFSWGDNSRGQLGRGPVSKLEAKTPKLIKTLVPYTVIQIASGNNHCLALTDNGMIFSWGDNRFCQLGLGNSMENSDKPNPIQCLQGIPVAQVATGGCHSFILSQSGQVFGWGKNSFGQLGVSDEKDRPHPSLCKSLKNQKVKYICCGEDHTMALTQDGGVFTFGSGTYGQLGHGMKNNEILPRKVMELMGSNVIQVACGRRHSVTLQEDSCKIYTFGAGGCGQLGTGTSENMCSPIAISGVSLLHLNGISAYPMEPGSMVVKRITAGGDHCFLIVSPRENHIPPDDFREHKVETKIKNLDEKLLREISKIGRDEEIPYHVTEDVSKTFSSASCINASFLLKNDEHYGCNSRNHGVDLEAVKANFKLLAECPNIVIKQKIVQSLENYLIPSLPSSPPDVETLRLYLILPELHLFEEPKRFNTLIMPFGKAILDLDKPASKVLEMWWGGLSSSYFLKIVYVYKETVVYILQLPDPQNMKELEVRYRALHVLLEVLKRLNNVNELKGQIVPYHKFYISLLKDKVNIKGDYIMWVQQNRGSSNQARLIFCNYPFTFDAAAKSLLLQTDALLQMQTAIDEVQRRNLQSLFLPINPANPCLVFYVSRQNIIHDTLEQLSHQGSADLKKPLKIVFEGDEQTIDAGGVRKEFFMLLLREILDPKYGMFKFYEESRLYWFSSVTFEDKQMYLLIGCLCGLAIYNFTIIQLSFPQALYKKLLKRSPNLEDMKELVPSVGRGLENLLEYPDENVEEAFGLTFEVTQECFGLVETIELVQGGASKSVTNENRKEYVDMYIDYVFNKSVRDRFEAFYHGFHKVCGGKVLELFHPEELRAMVTGNEDYDFIELEKNTDYKGEYHRYHETIKLFWDVFHDLSLEEKKKFLLFLTGSDKIPITGMKHFKITIQPMNIDEIYLPVAHTCFNLLDLPRYKSKEQMALKLKQAIGQTEGFGLV